MLLRKLYTLLDIGAVKSKTALKNLSGIEHLRAVAAFRILAVLKKYYERYAFSEVLKTDGGRTVMIYDFRDAEFEAELKTHGVEAEIRPALHPRKDLYMSPHSTQKRRPFFREFEFASHLMVRETKKVSAPTSAPELEPVSEPVKRASEPQNNASDGRRKVVVSETARQKEVPQARIVIQIEGAEIDNSF